MIPMSDKWNETITNQFVSRRCLASVEISLGEAFVDNKLNASAYDPQPTSKLSQLNDGNLYPDYKFAALDGKWKLGDDKRLSSSLYMQTGYRGWTVSNSSGNFTTSQHITITFNTVKLIDRVDISFDPLHNEYAVNFTLKFYNAAGTQIGLWTITNNTQNMRLITSEQMGTAPFTNVKSMRLDITKWSAPNAYAKVTELFGAREEGFTESDRIISIDIVNQSESTGSMDVGGTYSAKATVVLDNSDGYFTATEPYNSPYIKNKRMDISIGLMYPDGEKEYCSVGTFYIDSLSQDPNNISVTITAQNIMREFVGRPYKRTSGLHYPATIAQIFEDVIIASELPMQYTADAVCSNYTIPTEPDWGDNIDCRQALRHLAQAMNGRVYQDRKGWVRLEANVGATTTPIDTFANPVEDIGPSAYFDLSGRTSDVDGVTRSMVYGSGNTSAMWNEEDAEKQVGITNYPIQNNPILKTFAATQTSLHSVTARNILESYKYSTKMRTMNWRCNPALEAGDVVRILAMDGYFYDARVAQTSIHFAGGLRGTLTVRARSAGAAEPEIEYHVVDGELWYYVDGLFESFYSSTINSRGELIVTTTGPLSKAAFELDNGYLIMKT